MKYLKCISNNRQLKINEEIVCDTLNLDNLDWYKRGGFNFSNEENILRWITRGDTLC